MTVYGDLVPADKAGECVVDIVTDIPPNVQPLEPVQEREALLDHPPVVVQSGAVPGAPSYNCWQDAVVSNQFGVIALAGPVGGAVRGVRAVRLCEHRARPTSH